MGLRVEIRRSLAEVPAAAWDAVVGEGCPFFEHAFLWGLERTGCTGEGPGWGARHVLVWRGADLVGALALYKKTDSYGEFIFDWAWADAAQRAGLPYYPKMVCAAPFSPVNGPRFLVARGEGDEVREALLQGAREAAVAEPATGLHFLYITPDEARFLEDAGLAIRHTHQFQWTNQGYAHFDDFLQRFRSKRRNQIRRERRAVLDAGVRIRVVEGEDIGPAEMEHAWRFYLATVEKFLWGRQYLNRAFFAHLQAHFRARLMLVLAEQDGQVVAGALNVRKGPVLYGRYWGCESEVRHLHFEVCSYAGIEAAIERGVQRFEPGAGGGSHKWGRGFLPTLTLSAHEIFVPPLDDAVRRFLAEERRAVQAELEQVADRVLKPE